MSETIEFTVDGMECSNCVNAVTHAVTQLPGVRTVNVSLESGKVTADFDGIGPSHDELRTAIDDAGFDISSFDE